MLRGPALAIGLLLALFNSAIYAASPPTYGPYNIRVQVSPELRETKGPFSTWTASLADGWYNRIEVYGPTKPTCKTTYTMATAEWNGSLYAGTYNYVVSGCSTNPTGSGPATIAPSCPSGTIYNHLTDFCDDVQCPSGTHLVDNDCVPNDGAGEPLASCSSAPTLYGKATISGSFCYGSTNCAYMRTPNTLAIETAEYSRGTFSPTGNSCNGESYAYEPDLSPTTEQPPLGDAGMNCMVSAAGDQICIPLEPTQDMQCGTMNSLAVCHDPDSTCSFVNGIQVCGSAPKNCVVSETGKIACIDTENPVADLKSPTGESAPLSSETKTETTTETTDLPDGGTQETQTTTSNIIGQADKIRVITRDAQGNITNDKTTTIGGTEDDLVEHPGDKATGWLADIWAGMEQAASNVVTGSDDASTNTAKPTITHKPTITTGSCQGWTWEFAGQSGVWNSHCVWWDAEVKPLLAWFFYLLTAIYCFEIMRKAHYKGSG